MVKQMPFCQRESSIQINEKPTHQFFMPWGLLFVFIQQGVLGWCPPGSFIVNNSKICTKCLHGTYQPLSGSSQCIECNPGTFSTGIGMLSGSDCKNCAAGMYSVNSSLCTTCPDFTTSPQGSFRATECRAISGYYSKKAGERGIECPTDHICPIGTTRPAKCPLGTSPDLNTSKCKPLRKCRRFENWGLVWSCLTFYFFIVSCLAFVNHRQEAKKVDEIQISIMP